jgi:hypothetical protein
MSFCTYAKRDRCCPQSQAWSVSRCWGTRHTQSQIYQPAQTYPVGRTRALVAAITSLVRQWSVSQIHVLTSLSYNSAVFSSVSSNSYWAFSVGRAFLDGEQCMNCTDQSGKDRMFGSYFRDGKPRPTWLQADPGEISSMLESLWDKARASKLERLERSRCIDEYATTIQSYRRNLLLVIDDSELPPPTQNHFINGSHVYWGSRFNTYDAAGSEEATRAFNWICSASHDVWTPCSVRVEDVRQQDEWRVGWLCNDKGVCDLSRSSVEYCLSEPAPLHCKLHFEPTITTVITLLNLCKFNFALHAYTDAIARGT